MKINDVEEIATMPVLHGIIKRKIIHLEEKNPSIKVISRVH